LGTCTLHNAHEICSRANMLACTGYNIPNIGMDVMGRWSLQTIHAIYVLHIPSMKLCTTVCTTYTMLACTGYNIPDIWLAVTVRWSLQTIRAIYVQHIPSLKLCTTVCTTYRNNEYIKKLCTTECITYQYNEYMYNIIWRYNLGIYFL
jgi:hypothetical protein